MSYKWTPEEEHLLKLLRQTSSFKEISTELKRRFESRIPGFRRPRSEEAVRKKCERENITAETCKDYTLIKNPYSDRFEKLKSMQAEFKLASITRSVGVIPEEEIARKILVLSDIHVPFSREDLIEQALDDHSDANIVVINGDMLEGYVFSSYAKAKRIAALQEYRMGFDLVRILSERFPAVYLIDGNHDIRPARHLKSIGFEKEQTQILRPNLISRIANGEELDESGMLIEKHNFENVHYQSSESWYLRIGKTIFAHPHGKGSAVPGSTVKKLDTYFSNRYGVGEYDSIVSGHTHKIYKGVVNSRLLIEQGCLAGVMGYAHSPSLNFFASNGMNGYAVIYQDAEGNTCFNKSGPVFLGELLPPKKDSLS